MEVKNLVAIAGWAAYCSGAPKDMGVRHIRKASEVLERNEWVSAAFWLDQATACQISTANGITMELHEAVLAVQARAGLRND